MIRTELLTRGKGVEDDPYRIIIQYWNFDGNLLFEIDSYKGTFWAAELPATKVTIDEYGRETVRSQP